MKSNAPVREKLAPMFAIKSVLMFYMVVGALVLAVMQGCSTDKAISDCIKEEGCQLDVDVDTEEPEKGENGNGNGGDDDDDDDDPAQNDCDTVELGDYVSKNIRLGTLKKTTCPLSIRLFVTKFNGDSQTLEYTKFQEVTIGQVEVTCPKLIKRYNIDGELLERQDFDTTCNAV